MVDKKYVKIYIDKKYQQELKQLIAEIENTPIDSAISEYQVGKLVGMITHMLEAEATL